MAQIVNVELQALEHFTLTIIPAGGAPGQGTIEKREPGHPTKNVGGWESKTGAEVTVEVLTSGWVVVTQVGQEDSEPRWLPSFALASGALPAPAFRGAFS